MNPVESKPRVLITGVGGSGTLEIIRSLEASKRYELIGADGQRYSPGFPYFERHYVVPLGAAPEFSEAMRKLLVKEKPDFVIPLVDEEIPVVHRLAREHFPSLRVLTPRPEFCALAMDKWELSRAMVDANLDTARTWLATDTTGCEFPAIIKPRTGRGSRGFAHLADENDLKAYLRNAPGDAAEYIVQERLTGVEYTTSAVVSLAGDVLAVVPKEIVYKRGITRVGVTRAVPAIERLCRGIQERLRADGPFNVQLMLSEEGVPKVFEINPRYSTTVALTIAAGVDEVDVVLRVALGLDPGPLRFRQGLLMIRHETQFFVDEATWNPPEAVAL